MLTRLALIILLLAPAQAFAMPAAIAAIGAFLLPAGAAAATAFAVGMAVVQLGLTVGMSVYGSAKARRAERKAKADYNSKLQDRTITNVSTEAPYRYVYGRAKVGSSIVAIFTSGNKDQYKHLVCVHAAHECDAIEEVYVAGKALGALDSGGSVASGDYFQTRTESEVLRTTGTSVFLRQTALTNSVYAFYEEDQGEGIVQVAVPATVSNLTVSFANLTGRQILVYYNYALGLPRVSVQKHLGTPTDGADTLLMAAAPGKWTANSVLRGFCYTVVTLDLNQPEFQGGIPSIEVLLRGKKLYDPRNGQTYWSQNPALAIYDYLRSEMCGVPAADIPLAQVISAANVCDADWGFGSRYTLNGTVTSEEGQAAVLEKMAQSMAGAIVSTTWDMFAGSYVAPVLQLAQSDIVGGIAVTPGASDADIYNGVRGQYVGADSLYVASDFKPYQNAAYLAADGRELWTNLDFPFTDHLQRVHNLARIYTEDQRNGYTVKATFSLKAWGAKVGDRIGLTSALFGWNAKVFRVTDKSYSPSSMIELTLKEDAAEIWDSADAVVADATPNTDLPNPFYVAPLASIACASGEDVLIRGSDGTITARILVSWPAVTQYAAEVQLEWSRAGSATWQRVSVNGSETSAYLAPVEDGVYYAVRARTRNPTMNTVSDWVYVSHQVIGKTAPPPNVETFAITNGILSWSPVSAIDLAGYIIRFQYGENRVWSNAAPLHDGLITQTPFKPQLIPHGVCTLLIKAVDTSGNESVNAAAIVANLGDVIVDNVILTYDDQAAGFPGQKTNCAVVDGRLVANDTGSLYWLDDDAQHYGLTAANYWQSISYAPLEYITQYVTQFDQVGSRMTLDTVVGTDGMLSWGADASTHFGGDAFGYWVAPISYGIEFRYGAPGVFWGADSSRFFPAEDGDLVWQTPSAWQAWPGFIDNIGEASIDFRITTQGGVQQGVIYTLAVNFDVPDEDEELDDIAISASGTRLPIVKEYRSIKNVQLTLQDNGGAAVTVKSADKATTGPLVYCYDAAGNKVAGIIDARIQGVRQ